MVLARGESRIQCAGARKIYGPRGPERRECAESGGAGSQGVTGDWSGGRAGLAEYVATE
jgi:hypothetical protein